MLTQGELAELASLSVYTVHAAEHGRNVSPKTGRALAAALGVDPSELLPKAQAPTSLASPEAGDDEERREPRGIQPEELKQRIAFMNRLQEERERQIEDVDTRKWKGDIRVWIFDVEGAEQRLASLYEEEGISDFAEAVNQGRRMTSDETRLLCQDFIQEFANVQGLTNRARIVAQSAESKTHVEGVLGTSAVEAWVHAQGGKEKGIE